MLIHGVAYGENARFHRQRDEKPAYGKAYQGMFVPVPDPQHDDTCQEQERQRGVPFKKSIIERVEMVQALPHGEKQHPDIDDQNIELSAQIAPPAHVLARAGH